MLVIDSNVFSLRMSIQLVCIACYASFKSFVMRLTTVHGRLHRGLGKSVVCHTHVLFSIQDVFQTTAQNIYSSKKKPFKLIRIISGQYLSMSFFFNVTKYEVQAMIVFMTPLTVAMLAIIFCWLKTLKQMCELSLSQKLFYVAMLYI